MRTPAQLSSPAGDQQPPAITRTKRIHRSKSGYRQPTIIGSIGDSSPFMHGGGLVLDHQDGHPTLLWFTPIDWDKSQCDEYGDPLQCEVYSVSLDRRQVLGDVETRTDVYTLSHYSNQIPYRERPDDNWSGTPSLNHGCPYSPAEYTEWWDESLPAIAAECGLSIGYLHDWECSKDAIERSYFYEAIAQYHGWHELTAGDVDIQSIADLRRRWSLRFYQARKLRRINVHI